MSIPSRVVIFCRKRTEPRLTHVIQTLQSFIIANHWIEGFPCVVEHDPVNFSHGNKLLDLIESYTMTAESSTIFTWAWPDIEHPGFLRRIYSSNTPIVICETLVGVSDKNLVPQGSKMSMPVLKRAMEVRDRIKNYLRMNGGLQDENDAEVKIDTGDRVADRRALQEAEILLALEPHIEVALAIEQKLGVAGKFSNQAIAARLCEMSVNVTSGNRVIRGDRFEWTTDRVRKFFDHYPRLDEERRRLSQHASKMKRNDPHL